MLHSFFDLGTRWMWVVSFTPEERTPWYRLDKSVSGPQSRSGRGGEEKNSETRRESNTRTPNIQPIAQRSTRKVKEDD
jgi:hypothetical protein